jgi:hypothetical protein
MTVRGEFMTAKAANRTAPPVSPQLTMGSTIKAG